MMMPIKVKSKNYTPVYKGIITQALNGYIVTIVEDEQIYDSENVPEIDEQMEYIVNAIHSAQNDDNEIRKIIKANNRKPSKNETKFKKVGVRIFPTFSEASAFLSFIFEEDELEDRKSMKTIEDFSKRK